MAGKVEGEMYESITGQLFEIGRQLRQLNGYPFNPELLKVHLQAAIDGKFQNQPPVGRYFMTVTLGSDKSAKALEKAVEANGKKISDWARQILKKTPISPEQLELDIYEVSGADLGFTEAAPRQDIYNRAFGYGFQVSPAEVGPKSRIKCNDKKWRIVGMDPITVAGGYPSLFRLDGDGDGLWLYTFYGHPDYLWRPGNVWLFVWPCRK